MRHILILAVAAPLALTGCAPMDAGPVAAGQNTEAEVAQLRTEVNQLRAELQRTQQAAMIAQEQAALARQEAGVSGQRAEMMYNRQLRK